MKIKKYFFEVWKDIYKYEELYQISNYGRIKSLPRIIIRGNGRKLLVKERMLKPRENNRGYLYVGLCKEGKHKICGVHQLVAQHFVPNPNNYKEVNHKDENKHNNVWTNLEFCDRKYNNNYGTRTEKCSKAVLQIDKTTGEVIKEFPSTHQVERETGFAQSNISSCCTGRLRQAYGYIWKYAS